MAPAGFGKLRCTGLRVRRGKLEAIVATGLSKKKTSNVAYCKKCATTDCLSVDV